MAHQSRRLAALAAGLALSAAPAALAQSLPYGDVATSSSSQDGSSAADGASSRAPRSAAHTERLKVTPYIEVGQVALAELSPGSDVLTYSTVAAGVDAAIRGRNNEGAVSLRYERRIAWDDKTADGDTISGLARVSSAIVPGALRIEAGGLAARTRVEGNGVATLSPLELGDKVTQVYSAYIGPSLATRMGDVAVTGNYRFGYNRVESPKAVVPVPGQAPVDLFDDSTVHSAEIHAGTKPGEPLPVGLGVGAGYNREQISNLDQRIEDFHARADALLPIGGDLALVGGVGYEDVEVSSRDAVRDTNGLPVIGPDGRFVTDQSAPRVVAFDTSGLIWDAGVVWRPSRRTMFEAHVGRRYGSTSYWGSFSYAPNPNSSFNVSVFDNMTSFGGQLSSALAALPTDFEVSRNPLTGDLTGCTVAQASGNCFGGALASVRSSVYRSRGVTMSWGAKFGRLQAGIGGGYNRRTFVAAPGTVLAAANGVVDQNVWLAAYLNGKLSRSSSFGTNVFANWYKPGDGAAGNVNSVGATAAYYRSLTDRLTATAAVGIDGVSREVLDDYWSASALLGLRYSF